MRASHQRVDVPVINAVEGVGTTCGQHASDDDGHCGDGFGPPARRQDHRGNRGDEEKFDDAWLRDRHVVAHGLPRRPIEVAVARPVFDLGHGIPSVGRGLVDRGRR